MTTDYELYNPPPRNPYLRMKVIILFLTMDFIAISFLLGIVVLVAGSHASTNQTFPILMMDTSSVAAAVKSYLNDGLSVSAIPDWYEPHFLSLCHGYWSSAGTFNKDPTTIVCNSRPGGYQFSVANELSAVAPAAARPFFQGWPDNYGSVSTQASIAMLGCFIGLSAISMICFLGAFLTMPRIMPEKNIWPLRVGYLLSNFAAVLLTNSASQITSQIGDTTGVSPDIFPLTLNAVAGKQFLILIWVTVVFAWLGYIGGLALMCVLKVPWFPKWKREFASDSSPSQHV